jgi:hypothetical protein
MFESLFIVALVFAVYFKTFKFGIVVDDMRRYEEIKRGHFEKLNWQRFIERRFYGFGTLIRKNKDGKWFSEGKEARSKEDARRYYEDRVLTTSIYAIICVLVYWAFGHNQISLCAALLCAVNPANNQVSLWANGRRYAINIILVLLMVLIGPAAIFLYPLTVIFQVTAILSPVIFGPWFALSIPVVAFLAWPMMKKRMGKRLQTLDNPDMREFTPKKLIPIVKVFGLYMKKMIFPGRTLMIYPELFYWGMTEKGNKDAYSFNALFYFGLACLISSAAVGIIFLKGSMLWMWLFMLGAVIQWCGFVTVTQVYADRYIALPSVFMSYFIAYFAFTYAGPYALALLALLAGNYFTNLQISMLMYRDIIAFWEYHFYFDRGGPKCREFKANNMIQLGDPLAAWETIKEGLKVNPDDFKLNLMASNCMNIMQDRSGCLMYLKKARENCYIGQWDKTVKPFQKAIFGIDIDEEMQMIRTKKSKMPAEQRENLKKIYDCLEGKVSEPVSPLVPLVKREKAIKA